MPKAQTNKRRGHTSNIGEGLSHKKATVKNSNRNTRIRTIFLKFFIIFVIPIGFLICSEVLLRVFNYGYSTSFFKIYNDEYLVPNPDFSKRFFPANTVKTAWPFKIPIKKQQGTIRIFVLGDSAAQGTPAPAFGFARILEVMMEHQFPGQKFEIVNAAMRGINSHVVIPIAEECTEYQADAILIYLGNNESVGLYAPEPNGFNIVQYPMLIKLKHLAAQTKVSQFFESIISKISKTKKPVIQDFHYFQNHKIAFNDKLRIATVKNFESNLKKICSVATKNGTKVFLSTVAVNLQDSPPFGSLHKNGLSKSDLENWTNLVMKGDTEELKGNYAEAIKYYSEALKIDPEYAELNYKIANCYKTIGDIDAAKKYYQLSVDYDALPFRSDSRINNVIRNVANSFKSKGVWLVDSEQAFFQDAIKNFKEIPGSRYFHEYVHFKFTGDYLLARTFYSNLVQSLELKKDDNTAKGLIDFPTQQECALRLAYTLWDELDIEASIVRLTASPLFQGQLNHLQRQAAAEASLQARLKSLTKKDFDAALAIYELALKERPNDWQIHFNYANLLDTIKNKEKAMEHYEIVLNYMPIFAQCRTLLENVKMELARKNALTPTLRANQGNRPGKIF
ncbi:MAG: tetratricopeptide repeat protein [Verrucomicrobiia bacterium]